MTVLMAPGGTLDMALRSFECGADSVFVGPKGWSRRPASDELSDLEIEELIHHAKKLGKDVRIAVDVIPAPSEVEAFMAKIEPYAEWGAGGVMVCDPGLIPLVRQRFPKLEIHVSVTAGVFNTEDVNFYDELGADYIVLPYRWGVAEAEEIRRASPMKLEAFMFQTSHRGRICPGRCYSSSYFHVKHFHDEDNKDHFVGSASRGGSCFRVCRVEWALKAGDYKHPQAPTLKSSPELLLWELPEYVAMGVERFKIPGRERSPDLVDDIVRFYRRALDHVLAGNSNMCAFAPEWQELKSRWIGERVGRDDDRVVRAQLAA